MTELPKDVEERFKKEDFIHEQDGEYSSGCPSLYSDAPCDCQVSDFKRFLAQELSSAVQKERERILDELIGQNLYLFPEIRSKEGVCYKGMFMTMKSYRSWLKKKLTPQPKGEK